MMSQGAFRKAFGALLTALAVSGALLSVAPSAADDIAVRFQGRVTWIAGEMLVVSTDDSPSVNVDLSQVDQDQYQRLASGDRVIVTGSLSTERNSIVATSIAPVEP